MLQNLKTNLQSKLQAMTLAVRKALSHKRVQADREHQSNTEGQASVRKFALPKTLALSGTSRALLISAAVLGGIGYAVYKNPPFQAIEPGDIGIRMNQMTGTTTEWRDGSVLVLPMVHELRKFSLRDHTYKAEAMSKAEGSAPVQSVEGLSVGIDLAVRYALDPTKISKMPSSMATSVQGDVVEPAVQGIVYKTFARYTVREIFSTKRAEIQQLIEVELKTKLAAEGVLLRTVHVGKVDLPADYRRGMDTLLAEELATQKMRYTLELKDKRVKETELDAEADKVKREKSAEAAAREQIIAARGQEEAMKHVLPFKQRQIEQRQLEAEAEKVSAIRRAEGSAQARRLEAAGEADSRQKLADAEVYRLDKVGKTNSEQMSREGVLITKHPLLIQKAMVDKLSDKVQVIIAPPGTDGAFLGAGLMGGVKSARAIPVSGDASEQDSDRADASNQKAN
jgi:regulator of protease activity HflC (stomatin/prohibitin superfamily)